VSLGYFGARITIPHRVGVSPLTPLRAARTARRSTVPRGTVSVTMPSWLRERVSHSQPAVHLRDGAVDRYPDARPGQRRPRRSRRPAPPGEPALLRSTTSPARAPSRDSVNDDPSDSVPTSRSRRCENPCAEDAKTSGSRPAPTTAKRATPSGSSCAEKALPGDGSREPPDVGRGWASANRQTGGVAIEVW